MIRVCVQAEPFDIVTEMALIGAGGAGAIASFTGVVRADSGVTAIELEHYPAMTKDSLSALASEAASNWSLIGCTLIHRFGPMVVGEAIVLVITSAPHRTEALEACAFLIDKLKTEAPFWKKEYRGAHADWVEAKASDTDRAEKWS